MKTRPLLPLILLYLVVFSVSLTRAPADTLPNAWQIADATGVAAALNFTNTLTPAQKFAATNNGWHFTVVSRLVAGSGAVAGNNPAQFMTYGHGNRRFMVGWDMNAAGQLSATLYGSANPTLQLTSAGANATNYHQHDLDYDPTTGLATYLFDGASIRTWSGLTPEANYNGQALFGSAASAGQGTMHYHRVRFAINGMGSVSEYHAGFEGDPATAPSPTHQGWTLTSPPAPVVTQSAVSPDSLPLPCRTLAHVDPQFAGTPLGADPDGAGPATRFGWDAFTTYEEAKSAVCEDGTIQVAGGDIKIVGLEPAGENGVRVVFDDLAGLGQGAECLYTLQAASGLTTATPWTYVQTLGMEDLGHGRHQFIAPKLSLAQAYYRVVVWTPGSTDTDHDGLADSLETALGTDPTKFDTDGDGFGDCLEVTLGSNPLDRNSLPPVSAFAQAEFVSMQTVIMETNSIVRIPVKFDRPYRGELLYEVALGSSAGIKDFTDLSGGRVAVSGTKAEILLQLKEDLEVEPIKTIALTLLKNTNAYYLRGVNFSHAVILVDNDASWAGTLVSPGMVSRFNLLVLRDGNQTTGWLRPAQAGPNSLGTIPDPLPGQFGWTFVDWTNTPTRLQAVTTNIPMSGTKLFGGQPLHRVIRLSAIPPAAKNSPYFFSNSIVRGLDLGPVVIGGRYTDTLTPIGGGVGNRGSEEGVFTLKREILVPPALTIPYVKP